MLAHPIQLQIDDPNLLEGFVSQLQAAGLDAIETRHSDHTPQHAQQYDQLAQKLNLLVSGGSDFHGSSRAVALGSQRVSIEVYHRLRDAHLRRVRA